MLMRNEFNVGELCEATFWGAVILLIIIVLT